MKIIIDERETLIFEQCNIQSTSYKTIQIIKQVLPLGDFILTTEQDETIAIIERKTLQDLLASIKDGRYEEQSYRLSNSIDSQKVQVFYLLEGNLSSLRTIQEKKLIYSVITSLHFFKGFQTLRTYSSNETSELLLCMADKIERNFQKGLSLKKTSQNNINGESNNIPSEEIANYCTVVKKIKKENITPENIGEIILSQIPGISSVTAIAIMKNFNNISLLIDTMKQNPNCLENIQYETNGKMRKISKSCIQSIIKYLLPSM